MTTQSHAATRAATRPPQRQVERALDQAEIMRALRPRRTRRRHSARANGRATKRLRAALASTAKVPPLTRSELEEAFLAIVDAAGSPPRDQHPRLRPRSRRLLARASPRRRGRLNRAHSLTPHVRGRPSPRHRGPGPHIRAVRFTDRGSPPTTPSRRARAPCRFRPDPFVIGSNGGERRRHEPGGWNALPAPHLR